MRMVTERVLALGHPRTIRYDEEAPAIVSGAAAVAAAQLIARTIGTTPQTIAGWDTSQTFTAQNVTTLRGLGGYGWGARYVPLYGQSAAAGIQPGELQSIVSAGFGIMLVQFARTSGATQQMGRNDGEAAASAFLALGMPSTACLWLDCAVYSSASDAVSYCNAWYGGAVATGLPGASLGVYFEPGVPLSSQQRYQEIQIARYWQTGAEDANRQVATRGCQLVQLWPGDRTPAPGIIVDNDAAQEDFLGSYPIAAFAA